MANAYVNKVVYDGETIIDLTGDTISASDVINSKTFHDKTGATLTGTCSYDSDTSDATASASEMLSGKTAYVAGSKVTGTMNNVGKQTASITSKDQSVTISTGFHDGSGSVSLSSVEKAKIIPSNILSGIQILGVTGTVQPSSDIKIEASKSVTPSTATQTITPGAGFNAFAQVVVNPIPYTETDNASGGKTVTIG